MKLKLRKYKGKLVAWWGSTSHGPDVVNFHRPGATHIYKFEPDYDYFAPEECEDFSNRYCEIVEFVSTDEIPPALSEDDQEALKCGRALLAAHREARDIGKTTRLRMEECSKNEAQAMRELQQYLDRKDQ